MNPWERIVSVYFGKGERRSINIKIKWNVNTGCESECVISNTQHDNA